MRITVLDRDLLASLCRRIEQWESEGEGHRITGAQERAAWRLDVGVGQFNRMRRGKSGAGLNAKVFHRLYHYLPPGHVSIPAFRRWERDLDAALWAPEHEQRFRTYVQWLRGEFRRLRPRWRDQWPVYQPQGSEPYSTAQRLLAELIATHEEAFAPLERWAERVAASRVKPAVGKLPPAQYAPHVTSAQRREYERMRRDPRNHLEHTERLRLHLAYLRVVEPLLASAVSGGVELAAAEMGARLPAYLRLAVKREVLLLQRDPDLTRVQRSRLARKRLRTPARAAS